MRLCVWFCVLHQPAITDNDMQLLSTGGHCGSGTLCGIHTYVGEDDMWDSCRRALYFGFPQFAASATHILVSIIAVNRYTYPGLLLLL